MKTILNKYFAFYLILVFTAFGCESEDSFLESDYRGVITPSTVYDFDLLLNSQELSTGSSLTGGAPIVQMSDDLDVGLFWGESKEAFGWQEQLYNTNQAPSAWVASYKKINQYNTIYSNIDDALDVEISSNIKKVKEYKAEALLGRASEHFFLVNLFSQPYNEANKTKPGIPYIDFADITKQIPPRKTIEDTYNKIEEDLLKAIPDLPDLNENTTRGSKIGAYGILGRMHLYKGEWEKALKYIEKALDIKSEYVLYNDVFFLSYRATGNPDDVYVNTNESDNLSLIYATPISQDLKNLYESSDARLYLYFVDAAIFGGEGILFSDPFNKTNKGISIPELIVTKAELLVRLNRVQEGLDFINEFRNSRISGPASLFDTTDKEEALTLVLEERRRELCINGLRWFDMRRLDIEGRMGAVTHYLQNFNEDVIATYTLEPGSPRYTLQIPTLIIDQEGFEQNP